jgi:hypothetical protein
VERPEPVEPDLCVELSEDRVERLAVGDVAAGDEEVAGIEADAEPGVAAEPVEDRRQLLDRAADRAARAGGVLHQKPRRVGAALEQLRHRRQDALQPRLEAGAEVGADVEDDAVRVDRARDVHRVLKRGARLLVDVVLRCREVDEVERVADDAADSRFGAPALEALEARRVVVRRPPRPGALREDLHRVAAHRLDPVDRGVDPPGGGDVRPEQHGARAYPSPRSSPRPSARRRTASRTFATTRPARSAARTTGSSSSGRSTKASPRTRGATTTAS